MQVQNKRGGNIEFEGVQIPAGQEVDVLAISLLSPFFRAYLVEGYLKILDSKAAAQELSSAVGKEKISKETLVEIKSILGDESK